jgi:hypothetical protein
MSLAITTRAYDNFRSGTNMQETILTPAAIRTRVSAAYFPSRCPATRGAARLSR